jgi:peptide/nickel transport system substrate-binding protein
MSTKKAFYVVLALVMVANLLAASVVSAAPPQQEELTYTVKLGDTLWALAEKYLGSGAGYPAIVMATNAKNREDATFAYIARPDLIHPGWKFAIPSAADAEALLAKPRVVTMTFFEEPDSLNDLYTVMWYAGLAIDLFNPGLWLWDDNLEPSLEMAAAFPTKANGLISEDGLTITIPINPKARWSDGEPVTADDFVFTYEMVLDPANTVQTTWPYEDYLESVTAQDDYTLVLKFSETFAPWSTTIFDFVLPEHVLRPVFEAEGTLDDADWNRNPTVVNGAFIPKEWVAASHLIFEANPNYWRGRPKLNEIHVLVVPDDEAQMAAIKTGDTDIGIFLSYADIPTIEELPDVDLIMVLSGYNESWFFNLSTDEVAIKNGHVALQDVRVRQAIAYAVDFDAICEELLYGKTYPPGTLWEETPFAYPDANLYKYDPEKAKSLLDEAGWVDSNGDGTRDKDGVELVLVYSTTAGREVREQTQVVAMQYLADVGIGVEVANNSYDTMWNSYGDGGPIATGNYDIAEWSTTSDGFPDPSYSGWLCSEIPSDEFPEGGNWYGICDEELDALFQAESVEVDPTRRIELYYDIGKIMADKVYWLGVWHDNDLWTVNKHAGNVRISGADCFWNCWEWDVF